MLECFKIFMLITKLFVSFKCSFSEMLAFKVFMDCSLNERPKTCNLENQKLLTIINTKFIVLAVIDKSKLVCIHNKGIIYCTEMRIGMQPEEFE